MSAWESGYLALPGIGVTRGTKVSTCRLLLRRKPCLDLSISVGVGRRNRQPRPAWGLPGSRVKVNRSVPGPEIGGKSFFPWH